MSDKILSENNTQTIEIENSYNLNLGEVTNSSAGNITGTPEIAPIIVQNINNQLPTIELGQSVLEGKVAENLAEPENLVDGVTGFLSHIKETCVDPVIKETKEFTESNLRKICPDYEIHKEVISQKISNFNQLVSEKNDNLIESVKSSAFNAINNPKNLLKDILSSEIIFNLLLFSAIVLLIVSIVLYFSRDSIENSQKVKLTVLIANMAVVWISIIILLNIDQNAKVLNASISCFYGLFAILGGSGLNILAAVTFLE